MASTGHCPHASASGRCRRVCYVIKGTAQTQYADEAIELIKEGESFQDQPAKTHTIFGNPSRTEPLIFVCAARVKKGEPYFSPN